MPGLNPDYVPDRADLVWLNAQPQADQAQADPHPALVLSPRAYNGRTGLMLCCPIAHQVKDYPFEVRIEGTASVTGVVLADQVSRLDWRARQVVLHAQVADEIITEVLAKARTLLK